MNIVVTGGSGLVARHLQDILPDANYISSKDYNLIDLQQVRDMMKADPTLTPKAAMEKLTRSGTATLANVKESRISKYQENLVESDWVNDDIAGRKAAEAIEESGISVSRFDKFPGDEDDLKEDSFYVKENGQLVYYDGKQILEYSSKEQKFK